MEYAVHTICAETFGETNFMSPKQSAEVMSMILDFYDAGTPLYTKEALREIHKQLMDKKDILNILVAGLDGKTVDFKLFESSFKTRGPNADLELIPHVLLSN